MTKEQFEIILSQNESSILDFKQKHYKLTSKDDVEEAKFVKDVISFSNTMREESSYIIIGVEDINGEKTLLGLDQNYDEALLQDKVKDKVNPKPKFKYYSIEYEGNRFGVLEFPVARYEAPIMPVVKMKGLEIGNVYTRRGSTNSEATPVEIIQINTWITSVVPNHSKVQLRQSINDILYNVQIEEYYSPYLSKALEIAKQLEDGLLIEFCERELIGWNNPSIKFSWTHRNINSLASLSQITKVSYPEGTHISVIWNELKQNKKFWEIQFFLADPISKIETQIKNYRRSPGNQFTTYPTKASEMFDDEKYKEKDYDLFLYCNEQNLESTYSCSKQKFIELLTLSLSRCS